MFFSRLALSLNNFMIKISSMAYTIHQDEFWSLPDQPGYGLEFMRSFLVAIDNMLIPFGFFLCAILGVYAIVLGVNLARADDPKAAKKRIVSVLTSLLVVIVVVLILKFIFIPNMGHIFTFITETFKIA